MSDKQKVWIDPKANIEKGLLFSFINTTNDDGKRAFEVRFPTVDLPRRFAPFWQQLIELPLSLPATLPLKSKCDQLGGGRDAKKIMRASFKLAALFLAF